MRRAVVVGRAAGALEEYAAARALCRYDEVVVVGAMGEDFPDRIDHWVSFHSNLFDHWARNRAARGYPAAGCYWGGTHNGKRIAPEPTVTPLRYAASCGGSSGYMAVTIALDELGCERVVLAGMPMSAEAAHHGDAKPWREADLYWETWEANLDRLRPYARSMSGRTMETFGYPDKDWLDVSRA